MMKFTTPATASEPYTADAPPVSTSTREISGAGMALMSTGQKVGLPAGKRLPSISTSVRDGPRLRRLAADVPVAPFDRLLPWSAKADGNWFRMSDVLVRPVHLMSWEVITSTGLTLSSVSDGSREPVTSIRSIFCTGG